MNSNSDSQNSADFSIETESAEEISIDEFFRQLEAKEKDLDISAEMVIEIEDADDADAAPEVEVTAPPDLSLAEPKRPDVLSKPAAVQENLPSQIELFNLRTELSKLQIQLIRTENERSEMFENARRRHTDFENYKNRTEREREETFRNQLGSLAFQMLPVLDNMNRALDSTKNLSNEKTSEFQQFYEGIVLVNQQFNDVLAEMGVLPISAVGEIFDPHLHEAVATEATDETASNTITEELQRGYQIGDRVVRPSMVKVAVSTTTGRLPEPLNIPPTNLTETEQTEN